MIIRIKTNDYRSLVEFPIVGIHYDVDDNNCPIDIVIYDKESTLKAIAKFAWGEGNLQPLEDYFSQDIEMKNLGATHQILLARLNEFEII